MMEYGNLEKDLVKLAGTRVEEAIKSVLQISPTQECGLMIAMSAASSACAMLAVTYKILEPQTTDDQEPIKMAIELLQHMQDVKEGEA